MNTLTDTVYTESKRDNNPQVFVVSKRNLSRLYESLKFVHSARSNIVWSGSLEKALSGSPNVGRIQVHQISFGEKTLIRRESIYLPVTKSDCGNYFVIESEDLDMQLSEETLEDLEEIFQFMLRMTWKDYVMDDRENLAEDALELRDHLEATYRCV